MAPRRKHENGRNKTPTKINKSRNYNKKVAHCTSDNDTCSGTRMIVKYISLGMIGKWIEIIINYIITSHDITHQNQIFIQT